MADRGRVRSGVGGVREWSFVEDPAALRRAARALLESDAVGVDTESDSMHSYFEKVCLLQLSTPREAFIVDPLRLDGELGLLAPAFADPRIRKVFHGADYDVVCLKRDFGFEIANLFDTMVAAQCLGKERFGLADLVAEEFGEVLDKRHARTNWAHRPLTPEELRYSYLDVRFLIELARRLDERLREAGILEEAAVEFLRLESRVQARREFDPDGYRRIRGARGLSDPELAILRELYLMRDRQARRADRPPFKVLANETMVRISRARPRAPDDLDAIKGVTRFVRRRLGERILRAVSQGLRRGRPPPPMARRPRGERLTPRQQRQMDRLKEWRKRRAAELSLPNLVILPNHAILEVVKTAPRGIEELARLATVGEKRARRHGEQILAVLR